MQATPSTTAVASDAPVVGQRSFMGRLSARLMAALFRSPLRERLWTAMYNMAGAVEARDHVFMNLGYAALDCESVPATPEELHVYAEALYAHLVGPEGLAGSDVLDVGCGRGGGSAHLMKRFQPRSVLGIDRAQQLVARCDLLHQLPGLAFKQGDASHLPVPDGSIDVVVNVESSHCYASMRAFYAEVARVLRPGGRFLYADLFWPAVNSTTPDQVGSRLHAAGLQVTRHEDISANVFRARRLMSQSALYQATIERWMGSDPARATRAREFYSLSGSRAYEALRLGQMQYHCWSARRERA